MNCPACKKDMMEKDFGGIKVDICSDGCKGIWFDWSEIEKLDEKHEGLGASLSEALQSEYHKNENRGRINCPKCTQPMVDHFYKSCKMITVDECYVCGGFFLDAGELEIIRENFMDDQARTEYVNQLLAAKLDYISAVEKLNKEQVEIDSGVAKRAAAVNKFVGALGNKFQK